MPIPIRHVIPVSGKDSLCAAIVQKEVNPKLKYEYLFCDVRMELPETYQWLESAEKAVGIQIERVGMSLEHIIQSIGMLPSAMYRFCTKMAKIRPMQFHLTGGREGLPIIQYLGFRADEVNRIPASIDGMNPKGFISKFPLIEAGVDIEGVYKILGDRGILPPEFFWQRLYDDCYRIVGPASRKFMEECPPWIRSFLFSWRSRSNCFLCFFQRLYEWVGLLEHHPYLFDRAEEIEKVYGMARSEFRLERHSGDPSIFVDFHLHQGWPLSKIRAEAESIYKSRLKQVCKLVVDTRHNIDVTDTCELAATSCGAYCGK